MKEFLGIYWGAYYNIIFLPVLGFILFLVIRNYKQLKQATETLVHESHRKTILKNYHPIKPLIKLCASIAALILLFIALLQPQWQKKEKNFIQEGRELLVLLDVSRSMLAQDLKPNRLEFAKLKLKALFTKLSFERIGLILFSGSAFSLCPLTNDYATLLMFLDQVDVESISSGSTAIDEALKKAMETYKQQTSKNKLILLVTDGEDFSTNLQAIEQQASQEHIKIFALGVGTPQGAPIPKLGQGHEVDERGNIVLSKLNENLLQQVCNTLHGNYVRATYSDADLDYIVKLINKFEKEQLGTKKFSLYEDQYPWFLGAAWGCLALEWVL